MFRHLRLHADSCPQGPCLACKANHMRWRFRQLLPLTYRTEYETMDGSKHFAVWRMWFGRVFAVDDMIVRSV